MLKTTLITAVFILPQVYPILFSSIYFLYCISRIIQYLLVVAAPLLSFML